MTISDIQPSVDTTATGPAPLQATNIAKRFTRSDGQVVNALNDVSLTIGHGEMIVLLGPSGCGKTTLLRCVAGLEYPDAGTMHLAGRLVYDPVAKIALPANRRDINMMFQSYALWPHMTLVDNVAYPLRVAGVSRTAARSRAMEYLNLVGIPQLGKQYASQVSGGQQQRAALARTLVSEPALVLFDEPLSNVDAKVRHTLRAEISRLHHELRFAALYVTHDQSEAMALGDRVAVMNAGEIREFAKPTDLYARPTTRFAAEFLGSTNILPAQLLSEDSTSVKVRADIVGEITLSSALTDVQRNASDIAIMWRPENTLLASAGTPAPDGHVSVAATIVDSVYAGTHTDFTVVTEEGRELHAWLPGIDSYRAFADGDAVSIGVPTFAIQLIAS